MITRKRPVSEEDLTTMVEMTIPLAKEEFVALANGIDFCVEKERYRIDFKGRDGELDVFGGEHKGLAILEFEFPNDKELREFEKDFDLGLIDITQEEWLAGGRLAECSFAELAPKIAKCGR